VPNEYLGGRPKTPESERFWRSVDRSAGPDACWPWTLSNRIFRCDDYKPRTIYRVAWRLSRNRDPRPKRRIIHSCDTALCVNPSHLIESFSTQPGGFTAREVIEIRRQRNRGVSRRDLARKLNISPARVWKICSGGSYKLVKGPIKRMGIRPVPWYLIVKRPLRGDAVPVAYSQGVSADDAIRNFREQSGSRIRATLDAVLWGPTLDLKLEEYPTTRV
jgi:hypothetical protein